MSQQTPVSGPRPAPEEIELQAKRRELTELEDLLAEKEMEYANLEAELREFEREYYSRVGRLYVELDALEADIAELKAKGAPSQSLFEEQARQARQRAEASWSDFKEYQGKFEDVVVEPPSEDLKKLYRRAAKMLHPDLTTDEQEKVRRGNAMARANEAYRCRDEAALRRIMDEWHQSPDSVVGEGVAAELVRIIRKIAQVRSRIQQIEQQLTALRELPLWHLRSRVATDLAAGRDLLEDIATSVQQRIDAAKKTLENTRKGA